MKLYDVTITFEDDGETVYELYVRENEEQVRCAVEEDYCRPIGRIWISEIKVVDGYRVDLHKIAIN